MPNKSFIYDKIEPSQAWRLLVTAPNNITMNDW
jgi:hypothetical protein